MERVPSEKIEDPLTALASGASNDSDHATPSPVGVRGGSRLMRDGGIPMWASWIALVVAGGLALLGLRLSERRQGDG